MSSLKHATVYSLTAQYLTRHGRGVRSENSGIFITAPTSPPLNLALENTSASSISVTWEAPQIIGEGLDNLQYNIVLKGIIPPLYSVIYICYSSMTGQDDFTRSLVAPEDKRQVVFENLDSATDFLVTITQSGINENRIPTHD